MARLMDQCGIENRIDVLRNRENTNLAVCACVCFGPEAWTLVGLSPVSITGAAKGCRYNRLHIFQLVRRNCSERLSYLRIGRYSCSFFDRRDSGSEQSDVMPTNRRGLQ